MDSKEIKRLLEAYTAVYDDELRNELEEMSDEFSGIENLTDEEINTIVEETIEEMISEGYEFDEMEEIFEGVLLELNPYAPAGSKEAKAYNKATTASKKSAERSAARAATVSKVKGAVKSVLSKAKEVGKSAKFHAVDKPVASYATKRNLHPAAGSAARSKDPEKRRGLRAKVAADIKGRIKGRIAQAQSNVKSVQPKAKKAVKGVIGKVATKVADSASKLATKMSTEEVDVYNLVLEYLIAEGYADTDKAALAIMANMSESWKKSIIEG